MSGSKPKNKGKGQQQEDDDGAGGGGSAKKGRKGEGGDDSRLEGRLREISKKIISGGALGKAYEVLGLLDALVARVGRVVGHDGLGGGVNDEMLCVMRCYYPYRK